MPLQHKDHDMHSELCCEARAQFWHGRAHKRLQPSSPLAVSSHVEERRESPTSLADCTSTSLPKAMLSVTASTNRGHRLPPR